jgi:hypothetical protein
MSLFRRFTGWLKSFLPSARSAHGRLVDAMQWFKQTFGRECQQKLRGTPFNLSLLTAIAVQESYEAWGPIYRNLAPAEVLKLCVGDTIDAPGRGTFPLNREDLEHIANGRQIFSVAREGLEDIAQHNTVYANVAHNPDKFCHGFGIFQYDIQFCKNNPDYFLQRQWHDFDKCLACCLGELADAKRGLYGAAQTLTDEQMVYVAIVYNIGLGNFDQSRGFRQGFYDRDADKYYGEYIWDYLELAKTIADPQGSERSAAIMTVRHGTVMWDRAGGAAVGGALVLNLPQNSPLRFIREVMAGVTKWSNVELASDPSTRGWVESGLLLAVPTA